eukprot:NODE_7422_length_768_cov_16.613953_g7180_i0.p1 GENE.NODE_7422_length_768_cov_16.613953_g7180_i0~~NODE_7422_length_768_cov_16.613953_g7180_i0.p1  ORF type:complete len:105 (+),score=17.39 NODE_7422_length_768_cov_16.613953_g7180_i0:138-452(+)
MGCEDYSNQHLLAGNIEAEIRAIFALKRGHVRAEDCQKVKDLTARLLELPTTPSYHMETRVGTCSPSSLNSSFDSSSADPDSPSKSFRKRHVCPLDPKLLTDAF